MIIRLNTNEFMHLELIGALEERFAAGLVGLAVRHA
jgi:hypothetical protein